MKITAYYVQRTGTTAFVSLADEAKEKGVIFTDIVTAATEHAELITKVLNERWRESR